MNVNINNLKKANEEYRKIEREIARYLMKNPTARDSTEFLHINLDSKKSMRLFLSLENKQERLTPLMVVNAIDKNIEIMSESLLADINIKKANEIQGNKLEFDLIYSLTEYEYFKNSEAIKLSVDMKSIYEFKESIKDKSELAQFNDLEDNKIEKLIGISQVITGKSIMEDKKWLEDFILTAECKNAIHSLPPSYNEYKKLYDSVFNKKLDNKIILNKDRIIGFEKSESKLKELISGQIKEFFKAGDTLLITLKDNDTLQINDEKNKEPLDLIIEEISKNKIQCKRIEKTFSNKEVFIKSFNEVKEQNKLIYHTLNYKDKDDYLFIYLKNKMKKQGFNEEHLNNNKKSLIDLFAIAGLINGTYFSTTDNFVEKVLLTNEFKELINDLPKKFDSYKTSLDNILDKDLLKIKNKKKRKNTI